MNLVVNARDAMPDGGRLTIETADVTLGQILSERHEDVQPGPYAMLTVSDTGIGMDDETRQRVFEPFFTAKETGEGTGLGLSMVYGFIKQSGGYIDVVSQPGQGATFRLYLPLAEGLPDVIAEPFQADAMPAGSETILLAEDDEAVRGIMVRTLRNCGYTVLDASNAREALPLGKYYDGQIDLLVSDVVMPGLNGPELARLLKTARPEMRMLFVSGYAESAAAQAVALPDELKLLTKPFTSEVLAQTVRQLLDADADDNAG